MNTPELLAPAGNAVCALAAFDSGADAVYCGLSKFNARERSENFTPETLGAVIQYAHKLHKKVYVTFNTLIKETELAEVAEQLALLSDLEPDALIVQDLGVLRMIREYFPNLVIHASTQMGFHNSAGIELAKQMGAKRVILERQVTMDELSEIRKQSPLELEVFVHGALCCSLSGDCLFSSWHGGHSGNRGRCKQPCRRRFFGKNGNGFFFSPQDLCTIDLVPQLKAMGIDSFKIEGRLRQPDYVANVVKAYRMILDAAPGADRDPKLIGEARNLLSKSCGRKWSHGFFSEKSMASLIAHESIGAAGMLCGQVALVEPRGFGFVTTKKIHVGDRLRIQPQTGDEGPALTLTKMFVANAEVKKAKPGDEVFVCFDREAPYRGMVYKIGESFADQTMRVEKLPPAKAKLDLRIRISQNQLTCQVLNAPCSDFSYPLNLDGADKRPLNGDTVREAFEMADSDTLAARQIDVEIDGEWFMPAAVLKEARRNFWQHAKQEVTPESVFRNSAKGLAEFAAAYRNMQPKFPQEEKTLETVAVKPDGDVPGNQKARLACSIFDFNKRTVQVILPEFTPEGRLGTVAKAIKSAYDSGIRSFRVNSLFELQLLKNYSDIEIVAADPLPICNSMAAKELSQYGVTRVQVHVELDRKSIEAFRDHSPLPLEIYRLGRPVLLVTRAAIPSEGAIKDARANQFIIKADGKSKLTRLYPQSIFSIPRIPRTYDYYDLTNANWNNSDTVTFNFEVDLL